jgi:hypothetical protein
MALTRCLVRVSACCLALPCLLQLTLRRELIVSAQRTGDFFRLAGHRAEQPLAGFFGLITTH